MQQEHTYKELQPIPRNYNYKIFWQCQQWIIVYWKNA